MRITATLQMDEIQVAIASYCKERGLIVQPKDVSLALIKGDRPGDIDTYIATAPGTK